MKRSMTIICALILLVLGSSACQPTPATQPVAQKADILQVVEEQLEQQTQEVRDESDSAEKRAKFKCDKRWKEIFISNDGKLTINVDVDVEVPNVSAFPAIRVIEGKYSQDKLMEIIDYFAPDATFYHEPTQRTKEELTDLLVEAKRGKLIDGEYIIDNETQNYIKSLEQQIAKAPEFVEKEYVPYDEIKGLKNFDLVVEENGKKPGYLYLSEVIKGRKMLRFGYSSGNNIQTETRIKEIPIEEMDGWWVPRETVADIKASGVAEVGHVDIPIVDAQSIAQSLLDDLDIRGRTLAYTDKVVIFDENKRLISKGYEFIFMPDAGGLKGIYVNNSNLEKKDASYAAPFPFEYIKITVNESGKVQKFRWDNICEIKEVVIDSLEIMPFDEIKNRILKGIRYSSADAVIAMNSLDYEISIDITKVKLGACLTKLKDRQDEALLIPVWSVEYNKTIRFEYADRSGERKAREIFEIHQKVFNSIDSLTIDPSGY